MAISRKSFLTGGGVAAGLMALAIKDARAEEGAAKAMPPPPPPDKIHFPVLKPSEYDHKKVMAAMQVKKPHKVMFQSVTPHLIVPGLSSLYIHIQNVLNADEFSMGWGQGSVATGAVLYGPSIIFALNDAMWAKYKFGDAFNCKDAHGNGETANVYYKAQTNLGFEGDPGAGGNVYQDWSGEACLKRGSSFFVCHNALFGMSAMTAMKAGLEHAAVLADWKANLLPGFLVVPSGVGTLHVAMENGWKMIPLL